MSKLTFIQSPTACSLSQAHDIVPLTSRLFTQPCLYDADFFLYEKRQITLEFLLLYA